MQTVRNLAAQNMLGYGRQNISEKDISAVVEVLRSNWLTQGPAVEEFERCIGEFTGATHVVACNSGTAALHLAAQATGLCEESCAIVPAITFVATANAVIMAGGDVQFADVDPMTGLMTGETLRKALDAAKKSGRKVEAVFPVHLCGSAAPMEDIRRLADEIGASVIEDACHALSGEYTRSDDQSVVVGACSDSVAACFSFHPVKPITTAEGGAVTTNDAVLASRMRRIRSHGITRIEGELLNRHLAFDRNGKSNPWYYEMLELGWNYRISDLHSALGIAQLKRLPEFWTQRNDLATRYRSQLALLSPLVVPVPQPDKVKSGHHLFVVSIEFEEAERTRADVMEALHIRGVGTQVHYVPVPWQPYYRERYGDAEFPGAGAYYEKCLSLPLFVGMTFDDVDSVVAALKEVLHS